MKKDKINKSWWKKHWAEILFLIGVVLSIYFILKGAGYFA